MDFHERANLDKKVKITLSRNSFYLLCRALNHPQTRICLEFFDWEWRRDENNKKDYFVTESDIPKRVAKIIREISIQLGIDEELAIRQKSDNTLNKEMKQ